MKRKYVVNILWFKIWKDDNRYGTSMEYHEAVSSAEAKGFALGNMPMGACIETISVLDLTAILEGK